MTRKPLPNNHYVKPVSWRGMTAAGRRVTIAKDVIAGLKTGRLLPRTGSYVCPQANDEPLPPSKKGVRSVQAIVAKTVMSCGVCAKGAVFIAAVEKFNRVTVDASDTWSPLSQFDSDTEILAATKDHF